MMEYLMDDHAAYTKAFGSYKALSASRVGGETGSDKFVLSVFTDSLIQRVKDIPEKPDTLNVLSVGGGEGNVDRVLLEKLLPSFPHIHNTVIEPSASHLDLYRKRVAENENALQGISFDFLQNTAEEYFSEREEASCPNREEERQPGGQNRTQKFHLVTAIHVLYYVDDLKDSIRRLHDLVEDGGLLYIVVHSENVINQVVAKMNKYQENLRDIFITDEEVHDALNSLGLRYIAEKVPIYTLATSIFDDASEEGNNILDFMTHTKNFRQCAPDELKESILTLLKNPDVTITQDGQTYIPRYYSHIFVQK